MTLVELDRLRQQVVHVAVSNLGYGESDGNNRGPFLRAIGAPDGAEWCAYFAWYCYRRGAVHAGLELPFKGSGGAKKLGVAIGRCRHGYAAFPESRMETHACVLPGDLVILHRGPADAEDGPGHVRVVEEVLADGRLKMIHGNSGLFPAVVRRIVRDVTKERLVMVAGLR